MSDEKVLTKEIAEQFLADEDSVYLAEFTAIEDDAAEALAKHEGDLNPYSLTSLSDSAAESLSTAVCHNIWDFSARVLATQSLSWHQSHSDV